MLHIDKLRYVTQQCAHCTYRTMYSEKELHKYAAAVLIPRGILIILTNTQCRYKPKQEASICNEK